MEGDDIPPPAQPISFIRHDNPNQRFKHIIAGTTFPITISMYSATKLYFTITQDNVTIITSTHNAPHLRIIHLPHNTNIGGAHHNNNNNNGGALHSHNNGGALPLNNNGEALPLQNNGGEFRLQNSRETLLLNLHDIPHIENGNREAIEFLDLLSDVHGLSLRNLHTFPSFIHITSNNHTFAFHVTANNTIYVNDQALPIPPPHNDDNYHVINQPITIPLFLILPFNNLNNNTLVTIFIQFYTNNTIFIFANSIIQFLDWAAILSFTPQAHGD